MCWVTKNVEHIEQILFPAFSKTNKNDINNNNNSDNPLTSRRTDGGKKNFGTLQ